MSTYSPLMFGGRISDYYCIGDEPNIEDKSYSFNTLRAECIDNAMTKSIRRWMYENQDVDLKRNGKIVKFKEDEVRPTGRTASGCRGMNLDGSVVVGSEVIEDNNELLIVTENGYGKKTKVEDFRITKRGAKGVKALNTTEKTGSLISVKYPLETEDILLITNQGTVIKISQEQISTIGRNTQGIKLINLKNENKLSSVALTPKDEIEENIEE